MEITIVESVMVKPASPTPNIRIQNSSLDLLAPIVHIPVFYFYRSNDDPSFFDTKLLKEAIAKALVSFHPLAGRFANGRTEIHCNGEGVLFVEAETTSSFVEDMGEFSPMNNLYPRVDYSLGIGTFPLVVVQVTRFRCGGVSLVAAFYHTVADGYSFLTFVKTWSDLARGECVKQVPFLDRAVLDARDPPKPLFPHVEYQPPPSMLSETATEPAKNCKFKFTKLQIAKLREMTRGGGVHYSTFEVLAGHIWRCVSKSRGMKDEQETKLHVSTDGRRRFRPPLPDGYLGNVIFTAAAVAKAGETQFTHAHWVRKIHAALKRMDDEYLRSALDYLDLLPDLSKHIRTPRLSKCPNMIISSWVRLPVHETDFGWGRPSYVGCSNSLDDGLCYILPNLSSDGSLTIAIGLNSNHMELFQHFIFDF